MVHVSILDIFCMEAIIIIKYLQLSFPWCWTIHPISNNFFYYIWKYTGCSKKTLFYFFANISAITYSRDTSQISKELAWQEKTYHKVMVQAEGFEACMWQHEQPSKLAEKTSFSSEPKFVILGSFRGRLLAPNSILISTIDSASRKT